MVKLAQKLKNELWGFFALGGLLCVHTGIVMSVFALKEVTSHPTLLKALGIFLVIVGVISVLASWYFHRQKREKRPMLPCCVRFCKCCQWCDVDPSDSDDHFKERRTRSIRGERTKATTLSGFSTPEYRIYSEYLKRERRGVEDRQSQREKNMNLSGAQNAIYSTQSNYLPIDIHRPDSKYLALTKLRYSDRSGSDIGSHTPIPHIPIQ